MTIFFVPSTNFQFQFLFLFLG